MNKRQISFKEKEATRFVISALPLVYFYYLYYYCQW
jgi:hypothetical protein